MKVELIKQEGTKVSFKLTVDNEVLQYLVIGFSNFITNPTNP